MQDPQTVFCHSNDSLTFIDLLIPVGTAATMIEIDLFREKTLASLSVPSLVAPLVIADIQQKVY